MSDLRTAAQQALECLKGVARGKYDGNAADVCAALEAALAQQKDPTDPGNDVDVLREHVRHLERRVRQLHAQQAEPVQVAERERVASQWDGCVTHQLDTFGPVDIGASIRAGELVEAQQAEPAQEPYTGDVTRIMRDAGMTLHLGLPHKAVVEQMTRGVDLVYAEAPIKAAQQFSAALAQQAKPVWMHPWPPVRAQQAEPVSADPHTTTLRNLLKFCLPWEPDACVLGNVTARQAVAALRAALAQQVEPLNLRDPAVQKRLATQWGYVPAAQAEPVEPVATLIARRNDILRMAHEANLCDANGEDDDSVNIAGQLERFAALVTAAKDAEHQQTLALQQRSYEREIQLEVEAEREECAQIADAEASIEGIAQRIAAAIRARGNA